MIDEAESTLSSIDNASDRLVQSVLKQAHQSGNFSSAGKTCQQLRIAPHHWAARYNTWLLIKLTPKGVVFSVLSLAPHPQCLLC